MRLRERDVLREIHRAIGSLPGVRLWRANAGVAKFGRRVVRFGVPGQADLTGIVNSGTLRGVRIEVECKRPGGRVSPEQAAFARMIDVMGGIHVVATRPDDVLRVLRARGAVV